VRGGNGSSRVRGTEEASFLAKRRIPGGKELRNAKGEPSLHRGEVYISKLREIERREVVQRKSTKRSEEKTS